MSHHQSNTLNRRAHIEMYLDYSHIDRDDLVDVALPELTFNIVSKDTINLVFIC